MMFEGIQGIGVAVMLSSLFIAFVVLVAGLLKNKESIFEIKTLWRTYLYLMLFVSLAFTLQGGATFLRSISSHLVSPQFAYQLEQPNLYIDEEIVDSGTSEEWYADKEKIEIDGEEYYFDAKARDADLVNGLTTFLSLGIIFVIHKVLTRKFEKDDKKGSLLWKRVYTFASVIMFGVLSLVVIPTTIHDVVRFFTNGATLGTYDAPMPGAMLAALIVIVPTWIVFLFKMMKVYKKD